MTAPLLLFDGECGVCRHIAAWVARQAGASPGEPTITERPIGEDPDALRALNPDLDIWEAYATIHVLMPDGSMKRGGEAVAEVFRALPATKWFTPLFSLSVFGARPFQIVLDGGYTLLADVRPLLGCESCGTKSGWVKTVASTVAWLRRTPRTKHRAAASPHPRTAAP
jgi:predicted DCC family thiol-disulfide oxidoreductase YuxK